MMRYKGMVTKNLEMAETLLSVVVTGMNNQSIDASEAFNKISQALDHIRYAQEKVNLEPDQGT